MYIVLIYSLFLIGLFVIYKLRQKGVSFSNQVFAGMGFGLILGIVFQYVVPENNNSVIEWTDIIGSGFVSLLQMLVMPLVFVSIVGAIIRHEGKNGLGKSVVTVLSILIGTTIIASLIGIAFANIFNLSAEGFIAGESEMLRNAQITDIGEGLTKSSYAQKILEFIPHNIFLDFTGARKTSTIAVVIFSVLIGISARSLRESKPGIFKKFSQGVTVIEQVVLELVKNIIKLTPYGVLALMFKVVATSSISTIMQFGSFTLASYAAILTMFIIHLILVFVFTGKNPVEYIKNSASVLLFAFTSRSSAAALPMNVDTQISKFGVGKSIANLSASLGTTIGQNGCAAIYPAMLAVMVAPTVGIDPTSLSFILELVFIVAVSSFGVAGVGGGATIAALIVLSNLNLPITIVALLISIEPLIDMSRTALNVNATMTTGLIASKFIKEDDANDKDDYDTFNKFETIDSIDDESQNEGMCSIFR